MDNSAKDNKSINVGCETAFRNKEEKIDYLIKMSKLKTPKFRLGQANDDYDRICAKCSDLRNQAKDILDTLEAAERA